MNEHFQRIILEATGATSIKKVEVIQELWSGYGKILRLFLEGAGRKTVVVKHIQLVEGGRHPRGWHSDLGHRRKIKSYEVESHFYKKYAGQSRARLPECLAVDRRGQEVVLVLEDLNFSGFPCRKTDISWEEVENCLKWLADFHASYMGSEREGLWEVGTYWHLDTRPQELDVLADQRLKGAATAIDVALKACRYQTLVHGDAKLDNFCFSNDGRVAGVDFQYVGGGCGMKDVAYFVGSCMDEEACEKHENQILDTYFDFLHKALGERHVELESEWRKMYRVAWADFHRFLKGWSPGHWKINGYSERVLDEVMKSLGK